MHGPEGGFKYTRVYVQRRLLNALNILVYIAKIREHLLTKHMPTPAMRHVSSIDIGPVDGHAAARHAYRVMATAQTPPTSDTPTVFIIDDDDGLRIGLDALFRSVGYRTHQFLSAAEFMESGLTANAGCLVLDVRLPGLSGLDFQEKLATAGITMPVILMTGHGDIPMSVRGMKAGAVDFLAKPFREQDMLDAVTAALARDATGREGRRQQEDLRRRADMLSTREKEVTVRVAKGKMNKQIAFDLGLSEITVKIHRGNAMRKLGAKTLADFITIINALNLEG
jgi:FixJ family two-component response regulator